MAPKVVVTGLGIISPIGIGVSKFWKAALDGRQGVSAIKSFGDLPIEQYRSRVAGQIPNLAPRRATNLVFSMVIMLVINPAAWSNLIPIPSRV